MVDHDLNTTEDVEITNRNEAPGEVEDYLEELERKKNKYKKNLTMDLKRKQFKESKTVNLATGEGNHKGTFLPEEGVSQNRTSKILIPKELPNVVNYSKMKLTVDSRGKQFRKSAQLTTLRSDKEKYLASPLL